MCVLGIVKEDIVDGVVQKSAGPVNAEALTDAYFEKNAWSDWDKKSWADLTAAPCIIVSDVPKHATATSPNPLQS